MTVTKWKESKVSTRLKYAIGKAAECHLDNLVGSVLAILSNGAKLVKSILAFALFPILVVAQYALIASIVKAYPNEVASLRQRLFRSK